jgi:hypothetical protein
MSLYNWTIANIIGHRRSRYPDDDEEGRTIIIMKDSSDPRVDQEKGKQHLSETRLSCQKLVDGQMSGMRALVRIACRPCCSEPENHRCCESRPNVERIPNIFPHPLFSPHYCGSHQIRRIDRFFSPQITYYIQGAQHFRHCTCTVIPSINIDPALAASVLSNRDSIFTFNSAVDPQGDQVTSSAGSYAPLNSSCISPAKFITNEFFHMPR